MRRISLAALAACLFLVPVSRAQDLRAIVTRAIDAHGGAERFRAFDKAAVHKKYKGELFLESGMALDYEVELHDQGRDNQTRVLFQIDDAGFPQNVLYVTNGKQGWRSSNGAANPLDPDFMYQLEQEVEAFEAAGLLPLLEDKGWTMTALGDGKVEEQEVSGIAVGGNGKPEVRLWFEKKQGMLVKIEYWVKESQTSDQRKHYAVILQDFREPDLLGNSRTILKEARQPADGPALVALLRRHAAARADGERIAGLIRQLGSRSFSEREQAAADLLAIGAPARPALRAAVTDPDVEIASRAGKILARLNSESGEQVMRAVLRIVAVDKPEGAAQALLDFLPMAENDEVAREVQAALAEVAVRDGVPDPVLVQAAGAENPARKAAALAALGRDPEAAARPGRRLYLTGLKVPMRVRSFVDGAPLSERSVVEEDYYNALDPKLFDEPK